VALINEEIEFALSPETESVILLSEYVVEKSKKEQALHMKVRGIMLNQMRRRKIELQKKISQLIYDYKRRYISWISLSNDKDLIRRILPTNAKGFSSSSKVAKNRSSDVVRSEEEFSQVMVLLRDQDNEDLNSRYLKTLATVPPMILDSAQRKAKFQSTNGIIEDPATLERERKTLNPWTDEEKAIFFQKYLLYPKKFEKIAVFLENKTYYDVVSYYYLNKFNLNLKKALRQHLSYRRQPSLQRHSGPAQRLNLGSTSLEPRRFSARLNNNRKPTMISSKPLTLSQESFFETEFQVDSSV